MTPAQPDPTNRFSDLVANYVKYRPGYPPELYDYLLANAGLKPSDTVLDLGSGTGLLSELFLHKGHQLIGLEPNDTMRAAGEEYLAKFDEFTSLAGRAEDIPLPDNSVDFAVAGQSFHWFNPIATKTELQRVLKSAGNVALIWNDRDMQNSPFQEDYHQLLLDYGTDFEQVNHQGKNARERIWEFFAPKTPQTAQFPNNQYLDLQGLTGRLLSSSYSPPPGHPDHQPALAALERLFAKHNVDGLVNFAYKTLLYFAPVGTG